MFVLVVDEEEHEHRPQKKRRWGSTAIKSGENTMKVSSDVLKVNHPSPSNIRLTKLPLTHKLGCLKTHIIH